jgi:putative colanic acid biosynthesis acetyltransferase WcaF
MVRTKYPKYQNCLSLRNKAGRFIWRICYILFFRPFSWPIFHKWRNCVLRIFGAKIGAGSIIHASVKIWAPWNLEVGQRTAIGPLVDCYNPPKIQVGNKVAISQKSYLCTASHDYRAVEMDLITRLIVIKDNVWIASNAFVGMGVTIEEGAVVGARAAVLKISKLGL